MACGFLFIRMNPTKMPFLGGADNVIDGHRVDRTRCIQPSRHLEQFHVGLDRAARMIPVTPSGRPGPSPSR
jgi:hypothetical protein